MSAPQDTTRAIIEAAADPARPPLLMGILNVTPDSFYDGGRYADTEAAVARGLAMAEAGADIVDVGGESTRPCSKPVPESVEVERVLPVVLALVHRVPVSIDTRHARVAEAALDAGAIMVNDVSGFAADPNMPALLGRRKPLAVAMHMRGTPEDMMAHARYEDLLGEVTRELRARMETALTAGLPEAHLFLDPGIGFAKTWRQNLALLNHLDVLVALGRPLVVGVSRKSFIGQVLGLQNPNDRLFGTAGAVALAVARGARVLRVHDVAEMRDVARVAHAVATARPEGAAP